jgi:hypothetical protein
MPDEEWSKRLQQYAATGCWTGGNKPAPRQKKWYQLYKKVCTINQGSYGNIFKNNKCSATK